MGSQHDPGGGREKALWRLIKSGACSLAAISCKDGLIMSEGPTYRQVFLLEDPVDGEGLLPPDWSSFLCGESMTRSLV